MRGKLLNRINKILKGSGYQLIKRAPERRDPATSFMVDQRYRKRLIVELAGIAQSFLATNLAELMPEGRSMEQEVDAFRRYNYLKYKVSRCVEAMNVTSVTQAELDQVAEWTAQSAELRQEIVRANLRLVVSIAKKHVGWSPRFFDYSEDVGERAGPFGKRSSGPRCGA